MQINGNYNLNNVNGAAPQQRAGAPVPQGANGTDQVSLANSAALQQSLANSPASRPEAVNRAKQLISDPNYPDADVTSQMAQFLARKMMENTN